MPADSGDLFPTLRFLIFSSSGCGRMCVRTTLFLLLQCLFRKDLNSAGMSLCQVSYLGSSGVEFAALGAWNLLPEATGAGLPAGQSS